MLGLRDTGQALQPAAEPRLRAWAEGHRGHLVWAPGAPDETTPKPKVNSVRLKSLSSAGDVPLVGGETRCDLALASHGASKDGKLGLCHLAP